MVGFREMTGEALAHGAATIVNAIPLGKGAAFGIGLWTRARVELTGEAGVVVGEIRSDPGESTLLIERCVLKVFEHFHEEGYGAHVVTDSNIPIARGLKSNSVAANAVVLATASALGTELSDHMALNLAVDAALEAKTTITGAFDDASASYFGNIVVTDNVKRRIIRKFPVEDLDVLLYVPQAKSYTSKSDVEAMRLVIKQVEVAHREAKRGNFWTAMTLNGLIFSACLGYSTQPIMEVLRAGAIAAGLSGKGPAIAVVAEMSMRRELLDILSAYEGKTIVSKTNREKARAC